MWTSSEDGSGDLVWDASSESSGDDMSRGPHEVEGDLTVPEEYRLRSEMYEIEGFLGSGSFGCTLQVHERANPARKLAMKIQRIASEEELEEELDREIGMGLLLSAAGGLPFVARLRGAQKLDYLPGRIAKAVAAGCPRLFTKWMDASDDSLEGSYILIWMDLSTGRPASRALDMRNVPPLPIESLRTALFGMLWMLHGASQAYGFTHNDLNADNVLLQHAEADSYYTITSSTTSGQPFSFRVPRGVLVPRVIDFGKSTIATNYQRVQGVFVGAPPYVTAPEVAASFLAGKRIDPPSVAADVYAVGRIFLILLTQDILYDRDPETTFESLFILGVAKQPEFSYKPDVNGLYGKDYYFALHAALLYAYEFNVSMSSNPELGDPVQDTRYGGGQRLWQDYAKRYRLGKLILEKDVSYGRKTAQLIVRAIQRNYAEYSREIISMLSVLLHWDPARRVGREDSLYKLFTHPFFAPLRVNEVPRDARERYTLSDEGSLYYPQNEYERERRIRRLRESPFRVDKRMSVCYGIGCQAEPLYVCSCCNGRYCSPEHAH